MFRSHSSEGNLPRASFSPIMVQPPNFRLDLADSPWMSQPPFTATATATATATVPFTATFPPRSTVAFGTLATASYGFGTLATATATATAVDPHASYRSPTFQAVLRGSLILHQPIAPLQVVLPGHESRYKQSHTKNEANTNTNTNATRNTKVWDDLHMHMSHALIIAVDAHYSLLVDVDVKDLSLGSVANHHFESAITKFWSQPIIPRTQTGQISKLLDGSALHLYAYDYITNEAWIKQMEYLTDLVLDLVGRDAIPSSVYELGRIQRLDVRNGNLFEIARRIGKMTNLASLSLSRNNIEQLPESIGELLHLQLLDISHNSISDLPQSLFSIKKMTLLNLSFNKLTNISTKISALNRLLVLDIRGNPIPTDLPQMLAFLLSGSSQLELTNSSGMFITKHPRHFRNISTLSMSFFHQPDFSFLSHLSRIHHLTLSFCGLSQLPQMLTTLTQLDTLNLCNNSLSNITLDGLKDCPLVNLDVSKNFLSVIPSVVSSLIGITRLNLSDNMITRVSDELHENRQLRIVDLSKNAIASAVIDTAILSHLVLLDLSFNPLVDFPIEFLQENEVISINLASNPILQMKDELNKMKTLSRYHFSKLSPSQITAYSLLGQLTQLEAANFSQIHLQTFPRWISFLTQLQFLDLSMNAITEIPNEITRLSNLHSLDLSGNPLWFQDNLLSTLSRLPLEVLRMDCVGLASFHPIIQTFSNLSILSAHSNLLTRLPDEIGLCSKLEYLGVGKNRILSLPTAITNLQNLSQLDLSGNCLHNSLSILTSLSTLSELNVCDNASLKLQDLPTNFHGKITHNLNSDDQMSVDYFPKTSGSTRSVTGATSDQDPVLLPLQSASSDSNKISISFANLNTIPPSIQRFSKLLHIDLSHNNLSCIDPLEQHFPQLIAMDVSFNMLSSLPESLQASTNMQVLNFSNNRIKRIIDSIDRLKALVQIDASANALTSLPSSITRLNQLKRLNVKSNCVSFVHADMFDFLTRLDVFDVQANPLSISDLSIHQSLATSSSVVKFDGIHLHSLDGGLCTRLQGATELSLRGNCLSDLPNSFSALTNLQRLDLTLNYFSLIPAVVVAMTHIRNLCVSGNPLPAVDRIILDNPQSEVTSLDLSAQSLTLIPNLITFRSATLKSLDLSKNRIARLPTFMTKLTALSSLSMSENPIASVPAFIFNLDLAAIDLSNTRVSAHEDAQIKDMLRASKPWFVTNNTASRFHFLFDPPGQIFSSEISSTF